MEGKSRRMPHIWRHKKGGTPVKDHNATRAKLLACVEALEIVETRNVVERNQTDGIISGVKLTDVDYRNITNKLAAALEKAK
jgi:hypothetical protein